MKNIITIKDLNITKEKNHIIKDVSFDIESGERVGIIGPNGAGKTTLVEAIAGINSSYEGSIEYGFEYDHSPKEQIGIQFQDSHLPHGLKVKNIIELAIKLRGFKMINKKQMDDTFDKEKTIVIEDFLKKYDLEKFYKYKGRSLSGGERQRLNIGISIMHSPDLIILDEPTTAVDIVSKKNIIDILKNVPSTKSIIFISHNIHEIEDLCERALFIENGKIVQDLKIKDILKEHKSLQDYSFELFEGMEK